MGWKGAVRSVGVAIRAAERDAKRRQRELDRQQKQYDKMQELEQAAFEVDVYENHIDFIQSTHKDCSTPVDWGGIALSEQPMKPSNRRESEKRASLQAEEYTPSFIDRFFKREEKKRASFTENIANAIKDDRAEYNIGLADWEKRVEDWKESVEIANLLLQGEVEAKLEAIEKLQPFSEISNLGSNLSVSAYDIGLLEITVHVHGTEIIPNEVKSLLKSGRLSVKNMPKGRFNEIYQDYVCSCILRVANELFSIVPDKLVVITAVDELLNPKTGHLEESPILSAAISSATLSSLNLETLDPSDSMRNFIHNMSFKKTKGFVSVNRVNVENLEGI